MFTYVSNTIFLWLHTPQGLRWRTSYSRWLRQLSLPTVRSRRIVSNPAVQRGGALRGPERQAPRNLLCAQNRFPAQARPQREFGRVILPP